jgi:hypothetical protein
MSVRATGPLWRALSATAILVAIARPGAAAPSPAAAKAPAAVGPVRVIAVGDIACDPANAAYANGAGTPSECRQRDTSDLALAQHPAAALLLGDLQYDVGALAAYNTSFDPTWGRLRAVSRPAPGNHEYATPGAAGYRAYFGELATPQGTTWYSFELGGWHLVALDSNCAPLGGCGTGSVEQDWLRADLAAHPGRCTLAYWHHPRFSSALHGDDATTQPFWAALHDAGADLVLSGHDHDYERFAPQDPDGAADPASGIRELVVGTGGRSLYGFGAAHPQSEVRLQAFGVLALDLYPNGYLWRFLRTDGSIGDRGGALCHAAWEGTMPAFTAVKSCRVVDTRRRGGGGALRGERDLAVAGQCGVPADAVAVAVRATIVQAAGRGRLLLFPAGGPYPAAPTLAIRPGRGGVADLLLPLGVAGAVTADAELPGGGGTHLLLDVTGYFR